MINMIEVWANHAAALRKKAAELPVGKAYEFQQLNDKAERCEAAGHKVFDDRLEALR